MISGLTRREFGLVLVSCERYDIGCVDLVKLASDRGIPLSVVSSFVNVQREKYNLDTVNHSSYKDLLLDTVVSGKEYFFKCENLKAALATLVTVFSDEGTVDVTSISRIMKGVAKNLTFTSTYQFDVDDYIDSLKRISL